MSRVGLVGLLVLAAAACGDGAESKAPPPIVRDGWVHVFHVSGSPYGAVRKRCDGTTLVYVATGSREHGLAVVPLSPECAR